MSIRNEGPTTYSIILGFVSVMEVSESGSHQSSPGQGAQSLEGSAVPVLVRLGLRAWSTGLTSSGQAAGSQGHGMVSLRGFLQLKDQGLSWPSLKQVSGGVVLG